MDDAESLVGARIRSMRQDRPWSQEELAELMRQYGFNWFQSTVTKTEHANRPLRLNEAAALAQIFGIPLEGLVAFDLDPLEAKIREADVQLAQRKHRLERHEVEVGLTTRRLWSDVQVAKDRLDNLRAVAAGQSGAS